MSTSLLRRVLCILLGHSRGREWADSGAPFAVGENGFGKDHYYVWICGRCGELWRERLRPDPAYRIGWRRRGRLGGWGERDGA
jgi:hypothetical protein